MTRKNWSFADYFEELVCVCEILEIPGMKQKRAELVREMWDKFPDQSEEVGLVKLTAQEV